MTLVITHTLLQLDFEIFFFNEEESKLISKVYIKRIVLMIYTNK